MPAARQISATVGCADNRFDASSWCRQLIQAAQTVFQRTDAGKLAGSLAVRAMIGVEKNRVRGGHGKQSVGNCAVPIHLRWCTLGPRRAGSSGCFPGGGRRRLHCPDGDPGAGGRGVPNRRDQPCRGQRAAPRRSVVGRADSGRTTPVPTAIPPTAPRSPRLITGGRANGGSSPRSGRVQDGRSGELAAG